MHVVKSEAAGAHRIPRAFPLALAMEILTASEYGPFQIVLLLQGTRCGTRMIDVK